MTPPATHDHHNHAHTVHNRHIDSTAAYPDRAATRTTQRTSQLPELTIAEQLQRTYLTPGRSFGSPGPTRTARPLLLDLTPDAAVAEALPQGDSQFDTITAHGQDPAPPFTAVLLRPDSCVAWASASPQPSSAELEALRAAVQRWFGIPEPTAARR
ncbi:hypothetical protein GCM10012275_50740 [Longimycelium tulufanense]|uniref:Uncharacterized protein n=1 Tax=Longimycelium tulufanense TaxID=907463 RepID=A0A8J3CCI4_9PSEU|nr:hypothetical protein [Longimycelium tulufanense]GGM73900.1 hypothetical protein GCM10012275_50740 [Longimycelium tulufanense]